MGLDLRLYPLHASRIDLTYSSNILLEMDRDTSLYEKIKELVKSQGVDVSRNGISAFGSDAADAEGGWGLIIEDGHGDSMKTIMANDLYHCISDHRDKDLGNDEILAYIKAIEGTIEICLYWH